MADPILSRIEAKLDRLIVLTRVSEKLDLLLADRVDREKLTQLAEELGKDATALGSAVEAAQK